MISPKNALDNILNHIKQLPNEAVPLAESVGRVLSDDLSAKEDLPPFDNSAMDGYAIKFEDVAGASDTNPVTLKVREVIRAGMMTTEEIQTREAMRIMTGAPIPKGANAVVMQEMTQQNSANSVQIFYASKCGDHIRCHGEDVQAGAPLLKSGCLIRPYEVALMAAQGMTEVPVIRRPVVAVLATGDELVDASESISLGMIRNSNGPALCAALRRWNIESIDMGIIQDDPEKLENAFKTSLGKADVVIISGGVSVGEYDYTRLLFEKLDIKEVFWKAAIKPGKPLLFGVYNDYNGNSKPVFGLPGNPISVLVCLEEFVRPALEKLQGHTPKYPSFHISGKVTNNYQKSLERQQYVFCQVSRGSNGFELHIIRPQGSAMMGMACTANALAVAPIGVRNIKQGDTLNFRWLK